MVSKSICVSITRMEGKVGGGFAVDLFQQKQEPLWRKQSCNSSPLLPYIIVRIAFQKEERRRPLT